MTLPIRRRTALGAAAGLWLLLSPLHAQRTIDGSGNNLADPQMGAAGTPLQRISPAEYQDGLSAPAGATRPSAREISNALATQIVPTANEKHASNYLWQWGQFLDHDLDLSGPALPPEPFPIPVPAGDPFFDPTGTGSQVIALERTIWTSDAQGVRQQVNEITAWIDASNVYGSDVVRARELRALDGTGRLKVTAHPDGDLMPFNTQGLPNAPTALDPGMFLAGDIRANEQVGLTAMHTLFVREHNFLCDYLNSRFPGQSDHWYYQLARAVVGAEMQRITFAEFLPVLLGPGMIRDYRGYDPGIDASIANEFSTAAYRYGHSQLSPELMRLDAAKQPIPAGHLALRDAFFAPHEILQNGGISPLLRGLAHAEAQDIDPLVIDDVRNFLFGPPGAGGFDLVSLNIQRGRDHGLADYNQVRVSYGLPPRASFSEITSDPGVAAALESVYGSLGELDLWVGCLAEDHMPGAMIGETMGTIIADQFRRLRDGDRFWYERKLPPVVVAWVKSQTLAEIIRRNTDITTEIPDDVFIVSHDQLGERKRR